MTGTPTDLARDLARRVRGEVRFDAGSRALYATDGSNYRQPPIGVVLPRDEEDAIAAVEVCRAHDAPIFGRGGGTSLAGQCCNAAVCLDFSKFRHDVVAIDPARRIGRVQPGTILDDLRDAAERHGLTFGPDPATHSHCTLGGMVGNDSCGVHSVMAQFEGDGARTADNIDALDVLTYDGVRMRVGRTSDDDMTRILREGGRPAEIYTALRELRDRYADDLRHGFPAIPRCVSGYNLPALLPEHGFNVARALVGSESTCVTVLGIDACLLPSPGARTLLVLGYPSVYEAGDHVPEILEARPIGLEGMDDRLIDDMRHAGLHEADLSLLPQGEGWLLVEFGGATAAESEARARDLMARLRRAGVPPSMRLVESADAARRIWEVRESGLAATAHVSSTPTWPGWEDSAVPPESVGAYLRALRELLDRYGYACDLYGHFGQGCIHTRIDFDLETRDGIAHYRRFVEDAADLVVRFGGSLSGEHGDGQARGELLPRMFGPRLMQAFREFKQIWDPRGKMNPGKVIDPAPLDAHLRLDAHGDREPPPIATHFAFPEDGGRFRTATRRCVGVGKCRRTSGGVMCPSFVATREEMHSTRGRARLLFEMLEGDPLDGGWRDPHVREALDLCLACKGCRHDCPVGVDMATYKAEFLSHHYAGRIRPLPAYAFGYVGPWARVASVAPRLANLVTHAPGLGAIARAVAGIAPQRSIPAFAPHTFTHWFRRRHRPAGRTGRPVLLWPDTFNNHFHPDTAIAAVRVLERAGFDVHLPRRPLCCGRPLYDFGLLGTARRWLERILATIGPDLRRGVPVVGLEPSCLSVFRDELTNLLPDRDDARALARQSYTLAEFLRAQAPADALPAVTGPVLLHGHCHDKSVLGFDCQVDLLRDAGASVEMPESGCCGMAGAFGFERDHYDVSMAIGERALLPAVRRAAADRIVMADGFSCREQIAQATGRRAKHLAEVLDDAASRSGAAGTGPRAGEVRRGAATGAGASPRETAGAGASADKTAGAGASADETAGKGAASHAHIP